MLGLYVHIPFCARRCPYCDFAIHIGAGRALVDDYVGMLRRELGQTLREHAQAHADEPLATIYFGGGTPTLLESNVLADLLGLIRASIEVSPAAEISIEANPERIAHDQLQTLVQAGWNRISFGAQSFDPVILRTLGRAHVGKTVESAMAMARAAGFTNISLDLMYAIPGQDTALWRQTLEQACRLRPEHVSCYSLTIEPGTHFAERVEGGRLRVLPDELQVEMMQEAQSLLEAAGLERYEISNYARPGSESEHNLNYWRGGDYLACGCGAHGHYRGRRWWNERDTVRYVEAIKATGTPLAGEEQLTPRQQLTELVMLGLRLREGFDPEAIIDGLDAAATATLRHGVQAMLEANMLCWRGDRVALMASARPLADAVALRLLPETL